jgi:hypothetical protein
MKPSIDLVIASYGENLSWMKWIPSHWRVFLYCAKEDRTEFQTDVKPVMVPNGGREAGQYFQHLVDHYGDHSDYTIFFQGMPFDHSARDVIDILTENFIPSEPLRYVGGMGAFPLWMSQKPMGPIMDVFIRVFGSEDKVPPGVPGNIGAQFFVSKETILASPKSTYEAFLKESRADHPLSFGHLIEGAWGSVFNWHKFV